MKQVACNAKGPLLPSEGEGAPTKRGRRGLNQLRGGIITLSRHGGGTPKLESNLPMGGGRCGPAPRGVRLVTGKVLTRGGNLCYNRRGEKSKKKTLEVPW